ncbi:hypothetical protein [Anaerotardibacter muris]|uniref:hypothetical protein n=1 Tax=Anaerotardibacter muris TaxID=2941505 RepID=UPI00203BB537|nr:hypothetical protein [Anaerotardibacter muris]
MTKQAFNKIGIALALLLIALGLCCGIDAARATDDANLSNALPTESFSNEQTEGLDSLLEGKEDDVVSVARTLFDIPLNTELPHAFATEALDACDFEEAYVSGSTISFTFEGSCDQAQELCTENLTSKGWCPLESSDRTIQSFAKAEGLYRWLVLQYLSIDSKTVIIVNIIDPE